MVAFRVASSPTPKVKTGKSLKSSQIMSRALIARRMTVCPQALPVELPELRHLPTNTIHSQTNNLRLWTLFQPQKQ
jgi:hypothetical protein